LLASAIPGIDAVTNANAFQNGLDAEQDSAFRARFQNFIDSRSRATPLAIGYAIGNIQQGLEYTIQENVDTAGNPRLGSFVVTVDDGSGSPSGSLLATVTAAVDAVRPIGSIFAVQPPSVIQANVALTIAVSPATARAQAASAVGAAIAIYIDALPIGASLPISRIVQLVYGAHPAVSNVSQVQINSATTDITPLASGVVKAGTIAVN
jgi:uncharacterized phage protein gp47/JayE